MLLRSSRICQPCLPNGLHDVIDSLTSQLTAILTDAPQATIPCRTYHKHKRPGWDDALHSTHLNAKRAYQDWKQAGSATNPNNPLRAKYKNAKQIFWKELRKFKWNERDRFYNLLDVDANKWFRAIKLHKSKPLSSTSSLTINNTHFNKNISLKAGLYLFILSNSGFPHLAHLCQ